MNQQSIVTEINMLLSLNSNFVVKFIRRQANIVAHSLCIHDLVINEMS